MALSAGSNCRSARRVKQWTFYKRDEARIAKLKTAILAKI
jgi:ArsR family transcriptional regulator